MKWTKQNLHRAVEVLRKQEPGTSAVVAAANVSRKLKVNVSLDALRKALSAGGMKPMSEYIPAPIFVPQMIEQAEKRDETARLRQQVDDLVEQLRDAERRQGIFDVLSSNHEPPRIMRRERASGLREMTGVVLASDWHVEETVEAESVAFVNEYNLDIAARRVDRFFQAIVWNVLHERADKQIVIRDLLLWLGGDLITGYIHDELVESNALSPTQTILWLFPRLCDGIRFLLDELDLESITLPCSPGNHGRTTEKRRISTGYANSYEWLMFNFLKNEFRADKRVIFEVTHSAHQYVQVYDFMLHFHHGDELRYNGGIGGLAIPYMKALGPWDLMKRSDYHHIGHFHQLSDFGRAMVNGSLIGFNAFAQSIRANPEAPQQMMYLLDSKRGKCLTMPLWVEDNKPER